MNYELKFYYGSATNDVLFLGSYQLADEYTFNHYKQLIGFNIPFSIWFEHNDNILPYHRNVIVDNTALIADGITDNGLTTAFFIVAQDFSKLKFLTKEQFNDQNKINELINQLSRENLSRFF